MTKNRNQDTKTATANQNRDKNRDKSCHGFHSYKLVAPRFQSRSRSQMPSMTLFPDMEGISRNAVVNKSRGGRRSRFFKKLSVFMSRFCGTRSRSRLLPNTAFRNMVLALVA